MPIDNEIKCEEKEAIDELRKKMEGEMDPELYEDIYLFLRFLRARDLNVNNAEAMLRKHLEWREKNDIKNISSFKKSEVMEKYLPINFIGYDKEGCVLRYIPFGEIDFKGFHKSCKLEDEIKFMIYEAERDTELLEAKSKELGRNIDKVIFIGNAGNFPFAQATDRRGIYNLIILADIYLNNYPERMKASYVLNATSYFHLFFSFVKTLMPKTMVEKIHIYSDDSWKEDLLKIIDADQLPAFLGGNRTDPGGNPLCLTFVNHGGPVPEKYYIDRSTRSLAKLPGVETLTLSRAAFYEVKIDVQEPGSYLEWEFETKCRDIGFGAFYQEITDSEEKITEIKAIQRIDTSDYAETGAFKCEKAGRYVIVFDNTYSIIREKEISYITRVVAPKEYEAEAQERMTLSTASS